MAALAPTAINTLNTAVGGGYVFCQWEDPNPAGSVNRVKFWELRSDGTVKEALPTYDLDAKTFVWHGEADIRVALSIDGGGSYNPPTGYTTLPAGTEPQPAETDREKLEDVLGALDTGSRVVVYPDPTVLLTVNADGTVA